MTIARINQFGAEVLERVQEGYAQVEKTLEPLHNKVNEAIRSLAEKITAHTRSVSAGDFVRPITALNASALVEAQLRGACRLALRIMAISALCFVASIVPVFTLATLTLLAYAIYKGAEAAEEADKQEGFQPKDKLVEAFFTAFWAKGICAPVEQGIDSVTKYLVDTAQDLQLTKHFAITLSQCQLAPVPARQVVE